VANQINKVVRFAVLVFTGTWSYITTRCSFVWGFVLEIKTKLSGG